MLKKTLLHGLGSLILLLTTANAYAGFLYVLNERDGLSNRLYGYRVNEITGALTPLSWSPMSTNGNGAVNPTGELLAVDATNQRLYVVNNGTFDISSYSIDPATGDLAPLLPTPFNTVGVWRTIAVHPLGSPVVLGRTSPNAVTAYRIDTNFATLSGNVSGTAAAIPHSSTFSRDGTVYFTGGESSTLASIAVNPANGTIKAVPGSAFEANGAVRGLATDSYGRIFASFYPLSRVGGFTTLMGVPTAFAGNPFDPDVGLQTDGELHPNENFYYTDAQSTRITALQIAGTGSQTTLTPLAGSTFTTGGGLEPNAMAFNNAGTFLYTANSGTRNITIHSVNGTTGVLTLQSIQPADSNGTSGKISGMGYMPGVLTVSNTNNSGTGSLREALGLAGIAGVGVIRFDPSVFSTPKMISLSTLQLTINSNIRIVGPGADLLTIRNVAPASDTSRVFILTNGAKAILIGMTITGGNVIGSGGGISSPSSTNPNKLTLFNCLITGNRSSVIGGGISNHVGPLSIVNSTIANNTVTSSNAGGGGVDTVGYTSIVNSTISGNVKNGSIQNGGGIWTNAGMVIVNSTITNNSVTAGGGGIHATPDSAGVRVKNSIIAGNKGTSPDGEGGFVSDGYNFIGNATGATGFTGTGDQTGTAASPRDPKLLKVLTYKRSSVPIHVLLPDSTAIDQGSSRSYVPDERYLSRPINRPTADLDDGSDIGAVERQARESLLTAPFDFDGDNKTDIAIFRPSVAEWWINRSTDASTFATQFGATTDKIVPGDYTGDGKADVAVWRPSTGEWFVLRSDDFSFFSFPFGANGDIPVPADFDSDAKTDAAVFRPSNATWFVLNSAGGTMIEQFGASGDIPVVGDYDGDGHADPAIYRVSEGQWWIRRSVDGTIAVPFGAPTDKPVPGDYTGDGKTDVAFWRLSTGEWFVLRSEDFSFFAFPFGASSDLPAPGDYDGDGKYDATVFRPSSATWFSQRSSAGILIQQFGTSSDRPVPHAFVP